MEYILPCPSKINLTLRITGVRDDGMHNIGSLFYRLPSVEKLTLRYQETDNVRKDIIRVHGQVVPGRNLLEDVLEIARQSSPKLPPLEMDLWKEIPPGSGLGSGSGNAAALARWLSRERGVRFSPEKISGLGSDVSFLFDGDPISFRSGKGTDKVLDFSAPARRPSVLIVIPGWPSPTKKAYMLADEIYRDEGWPCTNEEAFEEGCRVAEAIDDGEDIGALPNDFTRVIMSDFPEYSLFFRIAESSGAFAWGIGGSGSAFFCLFRGPVPEGVAEGQFGSMGNVKKILLLE